MGMVGVRTRVRVGVTVLVRAGARKGRFDPDLAMAGADGL